MARQVASPGLTQNLEEMIYSLGERLGAALVEGFRGAVESGPSRGYAQTSTRSSSQTCTVPGCNRAGAAKGLCRSHYQKARRMKIKGKPTSAQLKELSQDGRKLRYQNA